MRFVALLALGCSGGGGTTPTTPVDTDTDTDLDTDSDTDTDADTDTDTDTTDSTTVVDTSTTDTAPLVLNGDPPAVELPVPEFTATAMDGTQRSQPDLVGHPTVLWFYPAAGTAG